MLHLPETSSKLTYSRKIYEAVNYLNKEARIWEDESYEKNVMLEGEKSEKHPQNIRAGFRLLVTFIWTPFISHYSYTRDFPCLHTKDYIFLTPKVIHEQ